MTPEERRQMFCADCGTHIKTPTKCIELKGLAALPAIKYHNLDDPKPAFLSPSRFIVVGLIWSNRVRAFISYCYN